MNLFRFKLFLLASTLFSAGLSAQTLYVPGGTGANGVGSSATGNVGIGISGPSHLLSINAYYEASLNFSNAVTTGAHGFQIGVDGTNGSGFLNHYDANYIAISTSNTERLRITSAGNVGVGTSGPLSKLEINGPNAVIAGGNSNISPTLKMVSGDAFGQDKGGSLGFGGEIGTGQATFAFISGRKETATSGEAGGYLQFSTYKHAFGVVDAVRISSSGNVGIGTTAPAAKLHVQEGDILLEGGTWGTSRKIIFKTSDNGDLSKYIGTARSSGEAP